MTPVFPDAVARPYLIDFDRLIFSLELLHSVASRLTGSYLAIKDAPSLLGIDTGELYGLRDELGTHPVRTQANAEVEDAP